MSNEHDDGIRESIPCVSFWAYEHGDGVALCLPVGYSLDSEGGVFYRGQRVSADGGERRAWEDAVAREKARRQGADGWYERHTAELAKVAAERTELAGLLRNAQHELSRMKTTETLVRLNGDSSDKLAQVRRLWKRMHSPYSAPEVQAECREAIAEIIGKDGAG